MYLPGRLLFGGSSSSLRSRTEAPISAAEENFGPSSSFGTEPIVEQSGEVIYPALAARLVRSHLQDVLSAVESSRKFTADAPTRGILDPAIRTENGGERLDYDLERLLQEFTDFT